MIVKTDDPRYNRDTYSNAILAKNEKALLIHREKIRQAKSVKQNENEINNLKSEIKDIKENVNKILQMLSKDKDGNI